MHACMVRWFSVMSGFGLVVVGGVVLRVTNNKSPRQKTALQEGSCSWRQFVAPFVAIRCLLSHAMPCHVTPRLASPRRLISVEKNVWSQNNKPCRKNQSSVKDDIVPEFGQVLSDFAFRSRRQLCDEGERGFIVHRQEPSNQNPKARVSSDIGQAGKKGYKK